MRPWWALKRNASMWKAIHQPRFRGQLRLTLESQRKCNCKCSRRRGRGLKYLFVKESLDWYNLRKLINVWCWLDYARRQRGHDRLNMQPVVSLLSYYPASIPNLGINLCLTSWWIYFADYKFYGSCAIRLQLRLTRRNEKDVIRACRATKADIRRSF